jgi:hypothetical protein
VIWACAEKFVEYAKKHKRRVETVVRLLACLVPREIWNRLRENFGLLARYMRVGVLEPAESGICVLRLLANKCEQGACIHSRKRAAYSQINPGTTKVPDESLSSRAWRNLKLLLAGNVASLARFPSRSYQSVVKRRVTAPCTRLRPCATIRTFR